MEITVASIKDGTNELREAARLYNLPVETLRRRVNDVVPLDCWPSSSTVLLKEEEDRLYEYLLEMAEMGYGLNREAMMKLAFTIAEKIGKSHPFKNETKEVVLTDLLSELKVKEEEREESWKKNR